MATKKTKKSKAKRPTIKTKKKPKLTKKDRALAAARRKNAKAARTRRILKKLDGLGKAPYARGSSTSRQAAENAEERRLAMLLAIRNYIEKQKTYGATCDEVEAALGYLHQTASARICDLKNMKLVVKSGKCRLTRSLCPAAVHVIPKYKRRKTA